MTLIHLTNMITLILTKEEDSYVISQDTLVK